MTGVEASALVCLLVLVVVYVQAFLPEKKGP